MDLVGPVILRLLAWDLPYPLVERLDLAPFHAPQLVAPLCGQKEQLEHVPKRPAEVVATGPEEADFVVG